MKTFKLIGPGGRISELSHNGKGYFHSTQTGKMKFVGNNQRSVRRFLLRKGLDLAPKENLDIAKR